MLPSNLSPNALLTVLIPSSLPLSVKLNQLSSPAASSRTMLSSLLSCSTLWKPTKHTNDRALHSRSTCQRPMIVSNGLSWKEFFAGSALKGLFATLSCVVYLQFPTRSSSTANPPKNSLQPEVWDKGTRSHPTYSFAAPKPFQPLFTKLKQQEPFMGLKPASSHRRSPTSSSQR